MLRTGFGHYTFETSFVEYFLGGPIRLFPNSWSLQDLQTHLRQKFNFNRVVIITTTLVYDLIFLVASVQELADLGQAHTTGNYGQHDRSRYHMIFGLFWTF